MTSIHDLKVQAQELGLDKSAIVQHGDTRKKSSWQSAVDGQLCLDIPKSASVGRIPISFGKTLEQLLSGEKTVTRRKWSDGYAQGFVKRCIDKGISAYPAFDKDRLYGGKQVGMISLICPPYKEKLIDMPDSDIPREGFPGMLRSEFIDRFFDGDAYSKVWVVRFNFVKSSV
ncbi:MAG: hypothetical protein VKK42_19920 [Lyngbya sp.]|nr:hypothetical protein [Lyngbya sp.]